MSGQTGSGSATRAIACTRRATTRGTSGGGRRPTCWQQRRRRVDRRARHDPVRRSQSAVSLDQARRRRRGPERCSTAPSSCSGRDVAAVRAAVRRLRERRTRHRGTNSGTSALHLATARGRPRSRRRGHHHADHVHRHGLGDRLRRRHARVRRHRSRRRSTSTRRRIEAAITPSDQGDRAGAPLRSAGRHRSRSSRSPVGTVSRSSRTPPRRTAPSTSGRRVGGIGPHRMLQLLPRQEPRRLRRGRCRRHQRRRHRTHGVDAP